MKVTFKEKKQEPISYPCIKYFKSGDLVTIALFSSERECAVLYTNNTFYALGRSYTINYPSNWNRFEGEIILQND